MTPMPDINEPTEIAQELGEKLKVPNAEFDAWVASMPAKHWSKYDLSACRLGWEAGRRVSSAPSFADGIEAAAKVAIELGTAPLEGANIRIGIGNAIAAAIRALAHDPQASGGGSTVHRGEKSVDAKMAILRESITSSEPAHDGHADPPRSGAAEGNEAEAPAPSLKDVILDAARHVRAQPAGLRGPYVIGDERLDGIIERLGPKSDASGAPKPDPAIAELMNRLIKSKHDLQWKFGEPASTEQAMILSIVLGVMEESIAALTASNDRVAELERERDEAREYGEQARLRENAAEDARIHEHDLRVAAEASLAKAIQERDEARAEIYAPGAFRCPKCGFFIRQFKIRASDGAVGGRDEPGEHCPNDGSPLWRVTWKQRAQAYYDRAVEEMDGRIAAEAEVSRLKAGAVTDEMVEAALLAVEGQRAGRYSMRTALEAALSNQAGASK